MSDYLRTSKTEDATAQRTVEGRVNLPRLQVPRVEVSAAVAAFVSKTDCPKRSDRRAACPGPFLSPAPASFSGWQL